MPELSNTITCHASVDGIFCLIITCFFCKHKGLIEFQDEVNDCPCCKGKGVIVLKEIPGVLIASQL